MIRITFCEQDGLLTGFSLHGHSGYAAAGSDIVCAAVTSCALMTANTVTEVCHLPANAEAADGLIRLQLKPENAKAVQQLLEGFRFHVRELSKAYPQNINCKNQKATISFRRCNNNAEN